MTMIDYARVSTQDQDLSGQLAALKGARASTVFKEKVSGVKADRPQLAKLMKALQPGDVVIVTKLDRLGRSTRELLNLLHQIDEAGAAFKSLGDPLFDTTTSQGRLLSTMLAAFASFERDLIRERTGEGRKRAMVVGWKRCCAISFATDCSTSATLRKRSSKTRSPPIIFTTKSIRPTLR
jgi:DNA invertase Pin-like site-specific DNA recombinase